MFHKYCLGGHIAYVFQYRKRYGLHAIARKREQGHPKMRFNTASGMDCMQFRLQGGSQTASQVSIPQAVWIACNWWRGARLYSRSRSFNTASGMDCMQSKFDAAEDANEGFQYRKRYGLHAIDMLKGKRKESAPFQYRKRYGLHAIMIMIINWVKGLLVSIPQAVWIACNKREDFVMKKMKKEFQYRKRYGLHAIYEEGDRST